MSKSADEGSLLRSVACCISTQRTEGASDAALHGHPPFGRTRVSRRRGQGPYGRPAGAGQVRRPLPALLGFVPVRRSTARLRLSIHWDLTPDNPRPTPSSKEHQHEPVSYTHLRAHETVLDIVCRLLLE